MKFQKVSKWIEAGMGATGFYLVETVKETDKAIAIKSSKFNSFGNAYQTLCWFPKSKAEKVANDYYTNASADFYVIPAWLYEAKRNEGFDL